jgi:hypothetical protein
MKYPAELYLPSPRPYRGLSELHYPFHDRTTTITQCGRICFGRRKINLSTVLAGQNVGVKEVSDRIWLVSFIDYDLEFFDPIKMAGNISRSFADFSPMKNQRAFEILPPSWSAFDALTYFPGSF